MPTLSCAHTVHYKLCLFLTLVFTSSVASRQLLQFLLFATNLFFFHVHFQIEIKYAMCVIGWNVCRLFFLSIILCSLHRLARSNQHLYVVFFFIFFFPFFTSLLHLLLHIKINLYMHIVRIVSLIQYKISYVFHMLLVFSYAIYVPTHGIKSAHRIQQKYIPCVIVSLDIRIGIFDAVIMPVLVCIPNIKKKKEERINDLKFVHRKKNCFVVMCVCVRLIGAQEACFTPTKLEQCMKFKKLLSNFAPRSAPP